MFPTLSDIINYLTGVYINMPIKTYGFFLALAFLVAGIWLYNELQRMERAGFLQGVKEKFIIGQPAGLVEILVNMVLGFLLGYKGVAAVMHWKEFSNDTETFLQSGSGSLLGGVALAIIMGVWRYYEKEKQRLPQPQEVEEVIFPHQRVGDLIIVAAIFGIVGSKIFTWIEDIDGFMRDPIGAILSFSGLTFYGGLICAAIAVSWYARNKKISLLYLIDATAPALILAYGIGRLGCHFSGDGDWGVSNLSPKPFAWLPDWAWAYTYPNNVIERGIPIPGCVGHYCNVLPEPVWPTSVYEFSMSVLIFLFLVAVRKKINIAGMLFSIYLFLNGLERFSIERVRINERYDVGGSAYSQAQIIAIVLMLLGIAGGILAYYYHNNSKQKNKPTA